ncbi:hypothetical protein [Stappia sp. ES.058]|uniref:hypothetical protein n=1 Tax=Stappia sp. ES.058 TaxID=1881061 RepID=UPI00087BBF93|nr:hypothetical protein [Stappia sp. ES.058]SDU48310.1 hypothetical protein SAMN05428979_4259 [Stappia sp. ES.058]
MTQSDAGESWVRGTHLGVALTGEDIVLDGGVFRDCRFNACRLHYDGGMLPVLTGCHFDDCSWLFGGPAANTLSILSALNQGGFDAVVERTVAAIRSGAIGVPAPAEQPAERGRRRVIDLGFGQFPVPRVLRRSRPRPIDGPDSGGQDTEGREE